MSFYPVEQGKAIPEIYHFSYDGSHFNIFLTKDLWFQFVQASCAETECAKNLGLNYQAPVFGGGNFGFFASAIAIKDSNGVVCIKIPAFVNTTSAKKRAVSMRNLGVCLSNIFYTLRYLLNKVSKDMPFSTSERSQLFVIETFVLPEPGFHSAGLNLTVSGSARQYFADMSKNTTLTDAISAMKNHYLAERLSSGRKSNVNCIVYIRKNGVIQMNTVGDCACLGALPREFEEKEGYTLESHNIDYVSQQFNLLVGIASLWQTVRTKLKY
jgi:hypothetical protein